MIVAEHQWIKWFLGARKIELRVARFLTKVRSRYRDRNKEIVRTYEKKKQKGANWIQWITVAGTVIFYEIGACYIIDMTLLLAVYYLSWNPHLSNGGA